MNFRPPFSLYDYKNMNQIKFITFVLLLSLTSVAFACGEKQEGKRIKQIYPIVGMNYSELSEAFLVIEKAISNEKILSISIHSSNCIYLKTGRVFGRLKGSGKSYIFQKTKGAWLMTNKRSWLS